MNNAQVVITIYTEHITARLSYVLDFCFTQKGQPFQLITARAAWDSADQKDINYSRQDLKAKTQVIPQGILFESEIYQSKKITLKNGQLLIDGVYDTFGLIFYLLSRYEAYFSTQKDVHDRLTSENNCLVKFGLNEVAVVDRMVKELWTSVGLDYKVVKDQFEFVPSFDIDVAWAYKNRNAVRSLGGILKGKKPIERLQVLLGGKKDPYDTYGEIDEIAKQSGNVINFILLGDWGKYDKNIHWENKSYQGLIKRLNELGTVGIHPSYASYLKEDQVREEKNRLATILSKEINQSRQHFLRLKIPDSYRVLEHAGINDDYSMGFADQVGFRAGTCFPFYFFDLIKNKKSNVLIHPFAYMDSAFKDYLKYSPNEAIVTITKLLAEVKNVGGTFMCIWHNSSIHDLAEWKGWKAVLDFTVKEGIKN